MNFVADRINRIKPSMTVGINIKAKAMKDEGKHDDPMGAALETLKTVAERDGHIRDGHFHVEGTYRYFAVQHSK